MKNLFFITVILVLLNASAFAGGQRMTALPEDIECLGVNITYRDLNLKSGSLRGNNKSTMFGVSYFETSENFHHIERFGYINWDTSLDDFGLYLSSSGFYRSHLSSSSPSSDFFFGAGIDLNFEIGFFDADTYLFWEVGPMVGFGYIMKDIGFSAYGYFLFDFIILSRIGSRELNYKPDIFVGFNLGLEYSPPDSGFHFGVEFGLLRETMLVGFFGLVL